MRSPPLPWLALLSFSIITVAGGERLDEVPQFEAAFQGSCISPTNPCSHHCIQLDAGTYECGCREGYELSRDGYSCELQIEWDNDMKVRMATSQPTSDPSSASPTYHHGNDENAVVAAPTESGCALQCLNGGTCLLQQSRCLCPLHFQGPGCEIESPLTFKCSLFNAHSFSALPPLSDAYIEDLIELELNPTTTEGVLLITGERTDYDGGDYMALLLVDGFMEFRFDCGSGPGLVRSREKVELGKWNSLSIVRKRWDGWMRLNKGEWVGGRSEGLFSRITFRQPVYVGGVGNWTVQQAEPHVGNLSDLLSQLPGLTGSLRSLKINDREYDLGSDSINGAGLEPCPDACSLSCLHGGQCLKREGIDYCLCSLGYEGSYCERAVAEMESPHFNTTSHLQYGALLSQSHTWFELELVIKPEANDGIVLYNDGGEDSNDFLSLAMDEGKIELIVELGSGSGVVRSPSKLPLSQFHTIRVSRSSRLIHLSVDNQQTQEAHVPGPYNQQSLGGSLYLGGIPKDLELSEKLRVRGGFGGCVQRLSINGSPLALVSSAVSGLNLGSCPHSCSSGPCKNSGHCTPIMEEYECQCRLGFRGRECGEVMEDIGAIKFNGDGWLQLGRNLGSSPSTSIKLDLRTTHTQGLLFYAAGDSTDFISIELRNGRLILRASCGAGAAALESAARVDDGEWHTVRVERNEESLSLSLDDHPPAEGLIPGKLRLLDVEKVFIGGLPHNHSNHEHHLQQGFSGCLRTLTLNGRSVGMLKESSDGRSLDYCE